MNKRFCLICFVIAFGLLVLSALGLYSLGMHEKGIRAERQLDFMDVAKRISYDVKMKVDTFLQTEQARLYTDYQPYYVPEIGNNPVALVPSPLANQYSNELANGYFQLDSDGQLTSPHFAENTFQRPQQALQLEDHSDYFKNVRENLLPVLQGGQAVSPHRIEPSETETTVASVSDSSPDFSRPDTRYTFTNTATMTDENLQEVLEKQAAKPTEQNKKVAAATKGNASNRIVYPIPNLKEQQDVQVITQQRDNYDLNFVGNNAEVGGGVINDAIQTYNISRAQSLPQQSSQQQFVPNPPAQQIQMPQTQAETQQLANQINTPATDSQTLEQLNQGEDTDNRQQTAIQANVPTQMVGLESPEPNVPHFDQSDTVQGIIEPFVSVTVKDTNGAGNGLFSGQVFLLRHVQIADRHLVQGFQLNEEELLSQITESARRLVRRGMGYEISKTERPDAAFAAILQFDFGEVVLNLLEQDSGYIQAQVLQIRNWFLGILAVVWLSVIAAMASMWKNLQEQSALSRQKDDFISAVSHELRTPLTSIRMYTEMLEKNWVKTDDKRRQYYTTMRTESERLTRLIENVLDFSRIQRGKKKYDFSLGDVNACIGEVAEMMRPYVEQAGFTLIREFALIEPFMFDRDAVIQIVINLVDNALKYAKIAEDKRIFLRTFQSKDMILIEVQDYGPGIPRSQQKKIFDAFYRCEDESTRQSTGTGLGLALVKRFAEAHKGFVEIANTKPSGVLFRVGLANR